MLYISLMIAIFSTMAFLNILIVDICNRDAYKATYNEEIVKVAKTMSLLRWVFIVLMSIFWPLSIVLMV